MHNSNPISFESFGLEPSLLTAIKHMKFEKPTQVQEAAIPVALQGRDVVASAQTGTGKTAAFLIPILNRMQADKNLKAQMIAPTRELALQIEEVLRQLSANNRAIRSAVIIGGASMGKQIHHLRANPQFIIGTPGRLMDHIRRKTLRASMQIIVLDEVDRMLDMGFAAQVQEILDLLPSPRQTLLFSATMPDDIRALVKRYTNEPHYITIGVTHKPLEKIKQSHLDVNSPDKNPAVAKLLKTRTGRTLIFTRTKHRTDRLVKFLTAEGLRCACIHGGRSQRQREDAIRGFQSGYFQILVATDIASRGLDISNIELVLNFDLPETREIYIHRIGRTARGDKTGEALSFVASDEARHWKALISEDKNVSTEAPRRSFRQQKRAQFSKKFKKRGFRGDRGDRKDGPQQKAGPNKFHQQKKKNTAGLHLG